MPLSSSSEPKKGAEGTANLEENESLLFFERLANPRIRTQLLDLLYKGEEMAAGQDYTEILEEDGENVQFVDKLYVPKSRQQVAEELEQRIRVVEGYTPIEFSDKMPTAESMTVGEWKIYGKLLTVKQKSIAEAHEKGHVIRPFDERFPFFNEYFQSGFDLSVSVFTDEEIEELRKQGDNGPEIPTEHIIEGGMLYLFSAMEIAERMAQLKNYFGMKGDEQLTAEQLAHARAHYVEDTGLDNNMTSFFKAITPQTEKRFLELINTSGI